MNKRTITPLLIDGIEENNSQELIYDVENPFKSRSMLYRAQGASVEDIERAVKSSFQAFQTWKGSSYEKRRKVLENVAALLESRRDYFVELLEEMGLSTSFANFNIDLSLGIIRECAANVSVPLGSVPQTLDGQPYAIVLNEPLGPILSIAPWNAPVILCIRSIAGPIAAGCSVVLKTSEQSPLIHFELARLFTDAGVPAGLVNSINHNSETAAKITEALVSSPYIKKITFTGSSQVGKIIATMAAKHLKPILLELGGKSAAIVTESANIHEAAEKILNSAFAHNGQICMSTERVYVVNEIYDEFMKAISKTFIKFTSTKTSLPQRSTKQAAKIESLLKNAVKHDEEVFCGKILRNDAYIEPLILKDVSEDKEIYDCETFGPVFFINRVTSINEAIQKVNTSRYGLSTAIWSSDIIGALDIARSIESGAVHINGNTVHDEPTLPHGGVKESGYGRFNGLWGLREFQYTKTITISK